MAINTFLKTYKDIKESQLFHRYIHNDTIEPLLKKLPKKFIVKHIGESVLNSPIYSVKVGTGEKRILLWSQMHGNESTTTKAIFDVFNAFQDNNDYINNILQKCTFIFIPILNPDGAYNYTRINANKIDLNRDAQDLSQPESKILRDQFDTFKPHFCFNLHGQRSIYGAGAFNQSAVLSFLSPAENSERSITDTRKKAMEIISAINSTMQNVIPNNIGRYDDTYNQNYVGDTFQGLGVPTVLYESGHFSRDYSREKTREFVYLSLLTAMLYISNNPISGKNYQSYFSIPQNEKCFYDLIIRNAKVCIDGINTITDIAFQYEEVLVDSKVNFIPKIEKINILSEFYGHREHDARNGEVLTSENEPVFIGYSNDFVKINNEKYLLK